MESCRGSRARRGPPSAPDKIDVAVLHCLGGRQALVIDNQAPRTVPEAQPLLDARPLANPLMGQEEDGSLAIAMLLATPEGRRQRRIRLGVPEADVVARYRLLPRDQLLVDVAQLLDPAGTDRQGSARLLAIIALAQQTIEVVLPSPVGRSRT